MGVHIIGSERTLSKRIVYFIQIEFYGNVGLCWKEKKLKNWTSYNGQLLYFQNCYSSKIRNNIKNFFWKLNDIYIVKLKKFSLKETRVYVNRVLHNIRMSKRWKRVLCWTITMSMYEKRKRFWWDFSKSYT